MNHLASNIRFLRKQKDLTQEQLAQHIGIKRAAMGAYEEGRSEPRLSTLTMLCQYFKIRMDQLVLRDLTNEKAQSEMDIEGRQLRVLPIVVSNEDEKEIGSLVHVKASAGYLNGYGDADYVGALPKVQLAISRVATRPYLPHVSNSWRQHVACATGSLHHQPICARLERHPQRRVLHSHHQRRRCGVQTGDQQHARRAIATEK